MPLLEQWTYRMRKLIPNCDAHVFDCWRESLLMSMIISAAVFGQKSCRWHKFQSCFDTFFIYAIFMREKLLENDFGWMKMARFSCDCDLKWTSSSLTSITNWADSLSNDNNNYWIAFLLLLIHAITLNWETKTKKIHYHWLEFATQIYKCKSVNFGPFRRLFLLTWFICFVFGSFDSEQCVKCQFWIPATILAAYCVISYIFLKFNESETFENLFDFKLKWIIECRIN